MAQTPAHTPPAEPQRLARLDGLRGLAACAVAFAYHTQGLFGAGAFDHSPAPVHWFHDWGWTFVDLFFVISGYIFAHVYLDGTLQSRKGLASFAVARAARLYPLHLLTLFVCAVLFLNDPANTVPAFLAHLFMLQGFLGPDTRGFNAPSWSISIEAVCYILFAMAASAGRRKVVLVTAAAIALALAQLVAMGQPGGPWSGDALSRGLLGFFIGQALWQARGRLAGVPSLALAGVLALGLLVDTGAYSSVVPFTLLAWPAALLLALRARAMESAPLRWLGDRSYAIYLVHEPVINAIRAVHGPFEAGDSVLALHALFAIVVLALSDLAFRFVETPGRSWIRAAWQRRDTRRALAPSGAER